jgi:hypothetical protein
MNQAAEEKGAQAADRTEGRRAFVAATRVFPDQK